MATEKDIQEFVHRLEESGWAVVVRAVAVSAAVITVACILLFYQFRGLSHAKAMEQAQIARELARGHGFTTLMIRPAALFQFRDNLGTFPVERVPDTYHAPLNPLLNAPFLWLGKKFWEMSDRDIIYMPDRIIAAVQIVCFLLSVIVNYYTARRLFDARLAALAAGFTLVCPAFWSFALAGLPQMLMLLIFSGALYTIVRAVQVRDVEGGRPYRWLALASVLFGLLALTHGLTMFIFGGAVTFCALTFRPWFRVAALMLAIFAICYSPWLVRNYRVCGGIGGVAPYSGMYRIAGTEPTIMRALELDLRKFTPDGFGRKITSETTNQMGLIYSLLGHSAVAMFFFVALLHAFKNPFIGYMRWGILIMWLGAVVGIDFYGLDIDKPYFAELSANDLHVLFIPAMIWFGLAFILYLWSQLQIQLPILRISFLIFLYLLCGGPLALSLILPAQSRIQWPPYAPPYINLLRKWFQTDEIITTDMPWAVAWYADRKSLWLPLEVKDFTSLADWEQLGGRLVGLYLTPMSGNTQFTNDIANGEFREWRPLVTYVANPVPLRDFPLRAVTPLPPPGGGCVLFADHDRWSERAD